MADNSPPFLALLGGAIALAVFIPMQQEQPRSARANYQTQAGRCDAAYPDFCIPPLGPDLDCSDIKQKNFTVRPPDPHRLDGNRDGIGCEPREE
ncbi:MAG: hypothetical protein SW833_03800 [Cyanobacteriota bacterium]|nr:hypothetical protein [Cyanobacteriota bacterium]